MGGVHRNKYPAVGQLYQVNEDIQKVNVFSFNSRFEPSASKKLAKLLLAIWVGLTDCCSWKYVYGWGFACRGVLAGYVQYSYTDGMHI